MASILSLVSKIFGNKYDKDIKSIEPIIKQIHAEHEKIIAISNDELREKRREMRGSNFGLRQKGQIFENPKLVCYISMPTLFFFQ